MFGILLYLATFFWIQFLFLTEAVYRKGVLLLFFVLAILAFFTWSKWRSWLCKRYSRAGILVGGKAVNSLMGDIIWLCLELFFIIFLYLIPGMLGMLAGGADLLFTAITVILFILILCDTQLDAALTGEKKLPAIYVRVLPVSLLASVGAVIYKLAYRDAAALDTAIDLLILFLVELIVNLGCRFILQKRREKTRDLQEEESKRSLRQSAWLTLSIILTVTYPLYPFITKRPTIPGIPLILGIIFVAQSCCLILFFSKKAVWISLLKDQIGKLEHQSAEDLNEHIDSVTLLFLMLCWLVFGSILPNLLLPGYGEINTILLCTLVPVVVLLSACLSYPFYPMLTGDRDLPAASWRIPYITLAACVYALVKIPMPWVDVKPLALLGMLAALEMVGMLLVRRIYLKNLERKLR